MGEIAAAIAKVVEAAGWPGFLVAGLLVGAVVLLLIFGKVNGLFAAGRVDAQQIEFQRLLIKRVETLETKEAELRADLATKWEEDRRQEMLIGLLRAQVKRLLDQLLDVKEGRLSPAAIELTGLGEVAP